MARILVSALGPVGAFFIGVLDRILARFRREEGSSATEYWRQTMPEGDGTEDRDPPRSLRRPEDGNW